MLRVVAQAAAEVIADIFFGIITRQDIRGGYASVCGHIDAIGRFIDGWNDRCEPFT